MKYVKGLRPTGSMVVAIIALVVACAGTAVAAATISGSDLVNDSVASKKIKNKTLKVKDFSSKTKTKLKGAKGEAGPPGADGPQGPAGPASPATYTNPQWGTILRNTEANASAILRGGPVDAPFGDGSLQFLVGDSNSKIAFGDETDFNGDPVSGLTAVGYRVFTTGENSGRGNPNMPSITFEVDPNGAGGTTTGYSSLVWVPSANSVSNDWSPYIDATTDGFWGLTGSQFNTPATAANCGLNGPRCTFAQVKTLLASGTGATILTAAVAKGKDYSFQGAVDGLRINGTVYDFEPFGVQETTP